MASIPSMVEMPTLILLAMTVFVASSSSSTIVEPQAIQISSTNLHQFFPSQWSNDKMFNLQQCWAAFTRIGVCVDEINAYLRILQSGGGGGPLTGLIGPVCCDVAKVMHEHCWPELIPDPFYLKVKFICAHHPLPSISPPVVGPPPTTQEPEYPSPSPAPQDPSPAPAPQDPSSGPTPPLDQAPAPAPQVPPQSPTMPQYPTTTDPQNPPDSSTPLQSPGPSPSAPQDSVPSSPTVQYTYPTPPGPPYKI